ncbi:MAG: DcaP family trimeric outer membrane transporter [Thermoanaerobaculia bacterium]|nr:DcaP family trimeric outer membrane transporter [Thermoanaerobaculia bacterium]
MKQLPQAVVACATLGLLAVPCLATEPAKQAPFELQVGEGKLRFYGFLRADAQYDDSKPNDPQVVAFIRSEDETRPISATVARPGDSDFDLHAKLTRFGVDIGGYTVEALHGAVVSGKAEIDFYNAAASESRGFLRVRHAYLNLAWKHSALLFGQTSDVISPLFPAVNADFVMWNAGNLADRRPQVRYTWSPTVGAGGKFLLQTALGATGAVDNQSLDLAPAGTSVVANLDGVDSAVPTTQLRLAYQGASWVAGKKFELGAWGHSAREELPEGAPRINGRNDWDSRALGIDIKLPLAAKFDFEAELWSGKNLDDVRGGIGQGVNVTAGDRNLGAEVESTGGWAQVGFSPCTWFTLYGGYSFDDPEDGLAASGARDRNTVYFVATRFKPSANLSFGLDYLNWTTEWTGGLNDGTDNRFIAYAQWNF